MSYFHIVTLTRFYKLIAISFFMLSAFPGSVSGMETKEHFQIRFLPSASQKFKNYCEDAVKRGAPHTELRERLFEFAYEGENSALRTLWFNTYKNKSLPDQERELRKFASAKNPYACLLLASCLSEQNNSECLKWYQIFDSNTTEFVPEFRGNYASAILGLKHPLETEDLDKVWMLLKAWRELDKTNLDEELKCLYSHLTGTAIRMNEKEFICDLYSWACTRKDNIIKEGIAAPIIDTEFADIVFERTGVASLGINKLTNFTSVQKIAVEQAKGYLGRNLKNKQTVANIVSDNLVSLLQDPAVKNIPTMPQYSRYFVDFKGQEPTEKHLICWARLIITNHRDKLIEVSGQDIALQDMAARVKNKELQDYVVAGFREIYFYDTPAAAPAVP